MGYSSRWSFMVREGAVRPFPLPSAGEARRLRLSSRPGFTTGGLDLRRRLLPTERLNQVGLGDFDGDHRCDVVAVNTGTGNLEIASGGTGTWTPVAGVSGVPFAELAFGDFDGNGVQDVFRRTPDGQWWAISPGHFGWTS